MKKISIDKNLKVKVTANDGGFVTDQSVIAVLLYLILCALIASMNRESEIQFADVMNKEEE